MQISRKDWDNYIKRLSKVNTEAAKLVKEYIEKNGVEDVQALVNYSYRVAAKYGNASASLAAMMYDVVADLEGIVLDPAELASLPKYGEVAKAVQGTLKTSQNPEEIAGAVSRLVKRTGQDTILQNAERDRAQFAWIPSGDTCAFCITLASRGWQNMSKKALSGGHAEHIHSNCDCTYMIRHSEDFNVAGYNPQEYADMYYGAEGDTPKEKINAMRRKFYAENKSIVGAESSKAEEFIVKIDSNFNDKAKERLNILNSLVNEYNSPLEEVIKGGSSSTAGEKGYVDLGVRNKMHLQGTDTGTVIHEFAHTLAQKKEDELGLSENQAFWKDIAKIRREYNQDVAKDARKKISIYAGKDIDEFMAEAFALAKLNELGEEIEWKTGLREEGLPYAQKVLEIINKYFKRK